MSPVRRIEQCGIVIDFFSSWVVAPNVKIDALNQRLAGERFQGKILSKISDNQFVLESDQLKKILIEANALK